LGPWLPARIGRRSKGAAPGSSTGPPATACLRLLPPPSSPAPGARGVLAGTRGRTHPIDFLSGRRVAEVTLAQPPQLRQRREIDDLRHGQIGMEEVEDQDEPRLRAVVPRRVQEGVVEDDASSLLLLHLLVPDLELAAAGHQQRQLASQLRIAVSMVRRDLGAGGERRVERGAELRHARNGAERADGLRAGSTRGIDLLAEGPQVGGGPLAAAGVRTVDGGKAGLPAQQPQQLPPDDRKRRLERRDPGEAATIVDLERGESRIEHHRALQRERGTQRKASRAAAVELLGRLREQGQPRRRRRARAGPPQQPLRRPRGHPLAPILAVEPGPAAVAAQDLRGRLRPRERQVELDPRARNLHAVVGTLAVHLQGSRGRRAKARAGRDDVAGVPLEIALVHDEPPRACRDRRARPVALLTPTSDAPSPASPEHPLRRRRRWLGSSFLRLLRQIRHPLPAPTELFLSHATADRVFADTVGAMLARHSIPFWYSRKDPPARNLERLSQRPLRVIATWLAAAHLPPCPARAALPSPRSSYRNVLATFANGWPSTSTYG